MKPLHAPWRINYILAPKNAPKDGRSIFTQIAESKDDEKNLVFARESHCFALLNTYPYNGGHIMVVPYRQLPDLIDLNDEELINIMRLTQKCRRLLSDVMNPDGFNIGINIGQVAGAGILEHLHLHIVPRWSGDTNFMPVLGDVSVVPQALQELADQLRAAYRKMPEL
jgi:ATP adenylyltransferase